MLVDDLQQATIQFTMLAKHLLPQSSPSITAAASATKKKTNSQRSTARPASTMQQLSVDNIIALAALGTCACGHGGHELELCSQFLCAGYVIDLNDSAR